MQKAKELKRFVLSKHEAQITRIFNLWIQTRYMFSFCLLNLTFLAIQALIQFQKSCYRLEIFCRLNLFKERGVKLKVNFG